MQDPPPPTLRSPAKHRLLKMMAGVSAVLLLGYFGVAYVLVPLIWREYIARHPALTDVPNITQTSDKHPGDPLNVALIGSKADVMRIMHAANWHVADALDLRSDVKIAADTVLKRSYEDAPVSSLYLWGHKQDLAFELPVDNNPRVRHHVRFWQSEKLDAEGRPLWMGSVTFDKSVGLSHTTGEITHHIDANLDAERDFLFANLAQTGDLQQREVIDGFHKILEGRNGGGDLWSTDGRLYVGVIRSEE